MPFYPVGSSVPLLTRALASDIKRSVALHTTSSNRGRRKPWAKEIGTVHAITREPLHFSAPIRNFLRFYPQKQHNAS